MLQVSFIRRQRSFTEEALRPRAAPIVAQSLPCFCLSLETEPQVGNGFWDDSRQKETLRFDSRFELHDLFGGVPAGRHAV